jgi:Protein of unknown function (DUF2914)
MNLLKAFSLVVLTAVFLCSAHPGEAAGLKITEMAVTTKIVKGNPIDSVHRISSSSVKALYCFTRLASNVEMNTSIKHVWYQDGVKVAEYDLPVKGMKWRTYSKKAVGKGLSGEWRVDALDSKGTLLKSVTFKMN